MLLEYNSSSIVHVDLFIPEYVPAGHRAKVSVTASGTGVSSGSDTRHRRQVIFSVLVMTRDTDSIQAPYCRQSPVLDCDYNQCPEDEGELWPWVVHIMSFLCMFLQSPAETDRGRHHFLFTVRDMV